jgi:hypothetical protein
MTTPETDRPATKQPTIDRSELRTILGMQHRSGGGGSGRGHRRSRRRSAGDRRTRSRGGRERRRRASHRRETVSVRTARMPPQPEGNKTRGAPSRRCRAPPRRDRFANLRLASRDPVAGSEYARPSSIVNRLYSVKRHICSGRECTTCRRIPDASAPGHERSLGLATVTNRQREEGPKRRSAQAQRSKATLCNDCHQSLTSLLLCFLLFHILRFGTMAQVSFYCNCMLAKKRQSHARLSAGRSVKHWVTVRLFQSHLPAFTRLLPSRADSPPSAPSIARLDAHRPREHPAYSPGPTWRLCRPPRSARGRSIVPSLFSKIHARLSAGNTG